ncbi:hypothetical protein ACFQL7_27590 [Halocatena marina]|uniref:Uncharacterized protein n=1 Tax=Halocatena marina TaxID=2934937 RepID=A0ABD5YV19_9EURY
MSEQPPRRKRERGRASSRQGDKYPLFEVDWWRVGGHVAGAFVFGGLYLFAVIVAGGMVVDPADFATPIMLLIGCGGVCYLLVVLFVLARCPRFVRDEAVASVALLLIGSRIIPRYTTIEARYLLLFAVFCAIPAVLASVWGQYTGYRARRPTDRSRRTRRR